jgi:CubicO group peptidase (beta-lactamase class C family)
MSKPPPCIASRISHILAIMNQRRTCSLVFAILSSVFISPQNPSTTKATRIDQLVSRYQQCGYFNGSILVAEHGKVLYERGVGYANIQKHTPNTPQTKFGIASISKQFTATLVLMQVAIGNLRLDATVSEILPWYRKDTGSRITIEQLLRHTSGLPPDYDTPEFGDGEAAARHAEPKTFAQSLCQPALVSEPGTRWNYSNCGYILLGLVLEQITGKSFDEILQSQLLRPLEMNDTGMDNNNLARLGGAVGYRRRVGPRYVPGPYIDRTHIFAAGSMYSSVEDLYRWNQALTHNNLFSELGKKIFTPELGEWGYGWFVRRIAVGEPGEGSVIAEMRGDMPGNFFAWILRYPEQDDVIIVLRNGYGSTENLEQNLQAILFDREPHLPRRSPSDIAAQVGSVSLNWIFTHRFLSSLILILFVFWLAWTIKKRKLSETSRPTRGRSS